MVEKSALVELMNQYDSAATFLEHKYQKTKDKTIFDEFALASKHFYDTIRKIETLL